MIRIFLIAILLFFAYVPHVVCAGGASIYGWQKPNDITWAEAVALMDFYNATGGIAWTEGSSGDGLDADDWGYSTHADDWKGITVSGGYVTAVDLGTNNLTNEEAEYDTLMKALWEAQGLCP